MKENKIIGMRGTKDRIYQRTANTFSGKLQDEIIMLDVKLGKYFTLNQVAARIWEMLIVPKTEEEICEALLAEYEVEEKECRAEVIEYLEKMIQFGLVTCIRRSE